MASRSRPHRDPFPTGLDFNVAPPPRPELSPRAKKAGLRLPHEQVIDWRSTTQMPATNSYGLPVDLSHERLEPHWRGLQRTEIDQAEDGYIIADLGDAFTRGFLKWCGVDWQLWATLSPVTQSRLAAAARQLVGLRELVAIAVMPQVVFDDDMHDARRRVALEELERIASLVGSSERNHAGTARAVRARAPHRYASAVFKRLSAALAEVKKMSQFKRLKAHERLRTEREAFVKSVATELNEQFKQDLRGESFVGTEHVRRLFEVGPTASSRRIADDVLKEWSYRRDLKLDDLIRSSSRSGRRSRPMPTGE